MRAENRDARKRVDVASPILASLGVALPAFGLLFTIAQRGVVEETSRPSPRASEGEA